MSDPRPPAKGSQQELYGVYELSIGVWSGNLAGQLMVSLFPYVPRMPDTRCTTTFLVCGIAALLQKKIIKVYPVWRSLSLLPPPVVALMPDTAWHVSKLKRCSYTKF